MSELSEINREVDALHAENVGAICRYWEKGMEKRRQSVNTERGLTER